MELIVLDFIGHEAQLGKLAGNDFCHDLMTLPVFCYLEEAEDDGPVHAVLSGQRGQEQSMPP